MKQNQLYIQEHMRMEVKIVRQLELGVQVLDTSPITWIVCLKNPDRFYVPLHPPYLSRYTMPKLPLSPKRTLLG